MKVKSILQLTVLSALLLVGGWIAWQANKPLAHPPVRPSKALPVAAASSPASMAALVRDVRRLQDLQAPASKTQGNDMPEDIANLPEVAEAMGRKAPSPARSASASAQAASAPQVVASAPQAKAANQLSADPKPPRTYTVKRGDTLSQLFGDNWKRVCEVSYLKDCNQLVVGDNLVLPEGVEPKGAKVAAVGEVKPKAIQPKATLHTKVAPRVVQPKTNEAGEILYRRVGVAPLNGCGKRDILSVAEEAWTVLGLSEEDRVWLRLNIDQKRGPRLATAPQGIVRFVPDMRLEQVTFCRQGKVVSMGPMRTAWSTDEAVYGEKFVLPSGKTLVWMRNCFNWVVVDLPPPPAPLAPPPPPPVTEEPLTTPPPPPPQQVIEAPAPKPKGMCDHLDPSAVVGQEHEPTQNGADSHSTFLTASVYCLTRLKSDDGSHGFGGKATYSEWHGSVNNGAGHYRGWNALVGPSYKRVMDEGYDWEVSAGPGKQVETYRQGAYASRREFNLVGITAGHNDYRRRLRGETWDVERQYFGTLTFPVGKKVGHTIFGQSIADTSELGRFNFGVQAGARWWFYENTDKFPLLPYLQGGLFVQNPTSASASARLGVSDPDRVVGVGIGFDQDLQNGGHAVAAWGWWLDLVRGVEVTRTKVRRHQVITQAAERGITVENAEDGGHIIRFGESPKAK